MMQKFQVNLPFEIFDQTAKVESYHSDIEEEVVIIVGALVNGCRRR